MIIKIAWRNIWRNKLRSFTVMGAVLVGVWALIFLLSFTAGFIQAYVNSAIENELSHLQLHHPYFKEDQDVAFTLPKLPALQTTLAQNEAIKAFATRSLNNGMLATARGSRGIQIRGITPQQEAQVTQLDKKIVAGQYFGQRKKSNPIIISQRLADKLH
jgi:ABC-type lipoprotein release transport system permease subunit